MQSNPSSGRRRSGGRVPAAVLSLAALEFKLHKSKGSRIAGMEEESMASRVLLVPYEAN